MASVSAAGRKQVTGSDGLKDTQTYPDLFGSAVASVASSHRSELVRAAARIAYGAHREITMDELFGDDDDEWHDADLNPVFDLLIAHIDRQRG